MESDRKTPVWPRLWERSTWNLVKSEEKPSGWPVLFGGNSEEKGDYMTEILPGEWVAGAIYWVPQSWVQQRDTSPLAGEEMGLTQQLWEAWTLPWKLHRAENVDWECSLLTDFPQLPQGAPQPELSEHSSPACLMLHFQAGTRVSMTEERLQQWDTEGPQTWSSVWAERAKPLLVLTQMVHQRQSKSHCGQTTTAHAPELAECPHWPLLLQHCSPLEQGCQCWKRGTAHIWRELSWLRLKLQGFHSSNLGPNPTLNRVTTANEHRTSSYSKLALDEPLCLHPHHLQGDSYWNTQGKTWFIFTSSPVLSPKPLDMADCIVTSYIKILLLDCNK